MKAIAASLATAAVLTGAAWASNVTPLQFSKLNARVVALEKSDADLQKYVTDCLKRYVAVSEYGSAEQGYLFDFSGSTIKTSALDNTQAGETPDYQLVSLPATKECSGTAVTPPAGP